MIGIAGASASGKTHFARALLGEISAELAEPKGVALIEEDAYYRDRPDLSQAQRADVNYDHPDAFEHSLLLQHLQALRNGSAVEVPSYDFVTHRRSQDQLKLMQPARVLVAEGILLLSDEQLCAQFDLKIFVDTPLDICLLRRIKRDTNERGRHFNSVAEQYLKTVRPMYYQFIEPAKKRADLVIDGSGDISVAIDLVKQKIHSLLV